MKAGLARLGIWASAVVAGVIVFSLGRLYPIQDDARGDAGTVYRLTKAGRHDLDSALWYSGCELPDLLSAIKHYEAALFWDPKNFHALTGLAECYDVLMHPDAHAIEAADLQSMDRTFAARRRLVLLRQAETVEEHHDLVERAVLHWFISELQKEFGDFVEARRELALAEQLDRKRDAWSAELSESYAESRRDIAAAEAKAARSQGGTSMKNGGGR